MNLDDAIKFLEEGRSQTGVGAVQNIPFYNPHILIRSMDRMELQKRYFIKLFEIAPCYVLNSGVQTEDEMKKRIDAIIHGDEEAALK